MAAAIERPMILTVKLGASHTADMAAVSHDDAMRATFRGGDKLRPCAIWVTYLPKSRFVVSQLWHRAELRA